jgi:hypothetical protein
MLTQEELKRQLEYNPDTGIFTRKFRSSTSSKPGEPAGYRSTQGYTTISINNKTYVAQRLVWLYVYGSFPLCKLRHINGVRSDNRLANLRRAKQNRSKV